MTAETRVMNGLSVDHSAGNGRPLLMIHGASGGSWSWENWMPRFAGAGFDCYALNLRGHPPSPPSPALGAVSLRDYADDVEGVMDALGEPPVLMGHSMGGAIAQMVAAERSVPGLILVGSAPLAGVKFRAAGFNIWAVLNALKTIPAAIRHRPFMPGYRVMRDSVMNHIEPARRRAIYARCVPESSTVGLQILRGSVAADLSRVRIPKLVIGGRDDLTSPIDMQREIAQAQGAEFVELTGHGHLPMLEPGWEQVADGLLQWLRDNGLPAHPARSLKHHPAPIRREPQWGVSVSFSPIR